MTVTCSHLFQTHLWQPLDGCTNSSGKGEGVSDYICGARKVVLSVRCLLTNYTNVKDSLHMRFSPDIKIKKF